MSEKNKFITIITLAALTAIAALLIYLASPDIDLKKEGSAKDLSNFGTYFGGVLTPVFTFFTLIILINTLKNNTEAIKQNKEMIEATNLLVEEASITNKISREIFLLEEYSKALIRDRNLIEEEFESRFSKSIPIKSTSRDLKKENLTIWRFKEIPENLHKDKEKFYQLKLHIKKDLNSETNQNMKTVIFNIRICLDNMRACAAQIANLELNSIIKIRHIMSFMEVINGMHAVGIVPNLEKKIIFEDFSILQKATHSDVLFKEEAKKTIYFRSESHSILIPKMPAYSHDELEMA